METTDRYAPALDAMEIGYKRLPRDADERFVRLGRGQWSARRRRLVDPYTTLYQWVAVMKAEAPQAWEVVNAAGVRLDGRSVRFKGRAVSGDALKAALVPLWGDPAVAAYERQSTEDALRRLESRIVEPMPWGRHLVGCGVVRRGDRAAELRLSRARVSIPRPDAAATVGQLCDTPEALATMARWALHAPDLVVAALWGLTPSGPGARPQAKEALAVIADRIRRRVRARTTQPKAAPFTADELAAMGLEAEVVVLQEVVWPTAPPALCDLSALPARVTQLERMRRSPLRPRTGWDLAQ